MVKHEWANGVEVNTSTLVIICFSPTLLIIAQISLCRLRIFKILRSTKKLLRHFLLYFLVGENQQFWKSCLSALLSARLNRIEDWARGQSNQLLLQKSDFHIFPTEMIPVFSN